MGEFESNEQRIAWLRARGVEIDPVYDKTGPNKPPRREEAARRTASAAPAHFSFVRVPAATDEPIEEESAPQTSDEGDALKALLGPRFFDTTAIAPSTVERETRGQLDRMVASSGMAAPRTETIQQIAMESSGAEAYPLAQPTADNAYVAVKMYIDEVGVLRQRPRNPRAETLAAELGLPGLSIHGDAYVGRTQMTAAGMRNLDFPAKDLDPTATWAVEARADHAKQLATVPGEMKQGRTDTYDWSQTVEDLEIAVRVPDDVRPFSKRDVRADYKSGQSCLLFVKGTCILDLPRLFDRISPDDASWSIDADRIVLSLEKLHAREWSTLTL